MGGAAALSILDGCFLRTAAALFFEIKDVSTSVAPLRCSSSRVLQIQGRCARQSQSSIDGEEENDSVPFPGAGFLGVIR